MVDGDTRIAPRCVDDAKRSRSPARKLTELSGFSPILGHLLFFLLTVPSLHL